MSKPDYDTTLARIAGNIAAGLVTIMPSTSVPVTAVALARAIVDEVKRTAPAAT